MDGQGPATKIGEAFFKLSHARAQAPAGAVAGKGIDPQWNADIFQDPSTPPRGRSENRSPIARTISTDRRFFWKARTASHN